MKLPEVNLRAIDAAAKMEGVLASDVGDRVTKIVVVLIDLHALSIAADIESDS